MKHVIQNKSILEEKHSWNKDNQIIDNMCPDTTL